MKGAFSVTLQTEIIFLLEIKIKQNPDCPNKECKRAYIKHAEATRGGGGGFYKFFRKKTIVYQEPMGLNISWTSNFFGKYFTASLAHVSFLYKAFLSQYFRVILTVTFKFQITKELNIHNNIQKLIFK